MSDPARGSQVHRNPAYTGDLHDPGCLCICCVTVDHDEDCSCWQCDSRRFYFESPPAPLQLVSTDELAAHIAELGLSARELARRAGVSTTTAWKASRPGRRLDSRTADKILALTV